MTTEACLEQVILCDIPKRLSMLLKLNLIFMEMRPTQMNCDRTSDRKKSMTEIKIGHLL